MPVIYHYSPSKEAAAPSPGGAAKTDAAQYPRIGAFQQIKNGVMHFYGFGVYEGDHYNDEVGGANPRLKLDSGHVLWGYQCWWGSEDKITKQMEKCVVIKVDPPQQKDH